MSRLWIAAALPASRPWAARATGRRGRGGCPTGSRPGALDEAGVGALAVDQEELATVAGGPERLPLDVDGLAHARGADDQPRAALHGPRHDDQAAACRPSRGRRRSWTPRATGPKWSSRTTVARRTADSMRRAASRCCGGPRPGRWPAGGRPGQGGGQQADRDGQGSWGHRKAPGSGSSGGRRRSAAANRVAGEVVRQSRPRPTLDHDHGDDGGQGGEGELPPAHPGQP